MMVFSERFMLRFAKGADGLRSKWRKHQLFMKEATLRPHLPETSLFSRAQLHRMVAAHRIVYVKPTDSSLGYGIIRVSITNSRSRPAYRLQYRTNSRVHSKFSTLYASLCAVMKRREYLIQQGIRLQRIRGRMFDVRLMVNRDRQNVWIVTGIAARLAGPGKIITNISAGGQVRAWDRTSLESLGHQRHRKLTAQMKQIAVQAARQLHKHWPALAEAGVDMALDEEHRIWILEVNSRPDIKMFTHLSDKRMLRKILQTRHSVSVSDS